MYCTVDGGADSADDAGASCGASASSTPAERRHCGRKAAAPGFCVDSRVSTLEWQTVCVGSRTRGPSAPARRGLDRTCVESARKWLGVPQWILALVCDLTHWRSEPACDSDSIREHGGRTPSRLIQPHPLFVGLSSSRRFHPARFDSGASVRFGMKTMLFQPAAPDSSRITLQLYQSVFRSATLSRTFCIPSQLHRALLPGYGR